MATENTAAVAAPVALPPFVVESFGLTDRGRVRKANEDCFVVAEMIRMMQIHQSSLSQGKQAFGCHRAHVFLVADGVGGNKAGSVASGISVKSVEEFLLNTLKRFTNLRSDDEQGVLRDLQVALCQADSRIFRATTAHPEWKGMATTMTMAFMADWKLFVAHAGDSRCYLFSHGRLQQITRDHTVAAEMVRRGMITREVEQQHPWRHVVTNILGGEEPGVQVELHRLDLHDGDVLLLCSDGLTEMVSESRIVEILGELEQPHLACERLVAEANQNGGADNVTAVVALIRQSAN